MSIHLLPSSNCPCDPVGDVCPKADVRFVAAFMLAASND